MYTKPLILLALAGVVFSRDINVGSTKHGVKIFDESREASPAIWKQKALVTVRANDTDVISGIVIKDARPDKDGEARIVDGGVGQQNVTIELKSPTVFRGFDFHIEVYAVPENEYIPELNATTASPKDNVPTSTEFSPNTEKDVSTSEAGDNTTPSSVTEEQESSSTTVGVGNYDEPKKSAHGAEISDSTPKFMPSLPSHPMVVATNVPSTETNAKSLHKRETGLLVEPMEVDDSEEEDDSSEEYESMKKLVPKVLLYKTDKLVTPIPYNL